MNRLLVEPSSQLTGVPAPPRTIELRSDDLDQHHAILLPIAFRSRPFTERRALNIRSGTSEPIDQFGACPREGIRLRLLYLSGDWKKHLN